MVREQRKQHASEWAVIVAIAETIGCKAETLRLWIRRDERGSGQRPRHIPEPGRENRRESGAEYR